MTAPGIRALAALVREAGGRMRIADAAEARGAHPTTIKRQADNEGISRAAGWLEVT